MAVPVDLDADRSAVEAARRDPRAFEALYRKYVAQVYNFSLYELRDTHAAEDLTAQVFLRALGGLRHFQEQAEPPESSFRVWLFQIARNALSNERRRRVRHPEAALDAALASVPKDYKVGRTPWGDPDLQGVWSYATTTPLSLRDGQENRPLTADEIAEEEERQALQADSKPRPGDPGTYNNHWFDRGKSIGRPSLRVATQSYRRTALSVSR